MRNSKIFISLVMALSISSCSDAGSIVKPDELDYISCAFSTTVIFVKPSANAAMIADGEGKEPTKNLKLQSFKSETKMDGSTTYKAEISEQQDKSFLVYNLHVNNEIYKNGHAKGSIDLVEVMNVDLKTTSFPRVTSDKCIIKSKT